MKRIEIFHTIAKTSISTHVVSHTTIFADRLEITLGQDSTKHTSHLRFLQTIRFLTLPELNEHCLRSFHLAFEAIFNNTLARIEIELRVSFTFLHSRERSDVLFGEGAERILVYSTGEIEVEVATFAETLSIELLNLFVVGFFQISKRELRLARVVAINCCAN